MDQIKVVETLKQTAEKNRTAQDVFHFWAMRERTRNVVTVEALASRMKKEGFDHAPSDYAAFLRQLSNLGLGKLDISPTGKVKALKDIKLTLQSIGAAAVSGKSKLTGFYPRNRFGELLVSSDAPQKVLEPVKAAPPKPVAKPAKETNGSPVNVGIALVMSINGKNVSIPVPQDLTIVEVAALVAKLKAVS
jgi:hypothetical protein